MASAGLAAAENKLVKRKNCTDSKADAASMMVNPLKEKSPRFECDLLKTGTFLCNIIIKITFKH